MKNLHIIIITILVFTLFFGVSTAFAIIRLAPDAPKILDLSGKPITGYVKSGQQIQITTNFTNNQDRNQTFVYIVQIQDERGATISLSWINGTLGKFQTIHPVQSWAPTDSGTYTAQIFVWQSLQNPNALQPPTLTTINVSGASLMDHNLGHPLKQFKSGIAAKDVTCKEGLHLMIKAEDGSPACVKLDAAYMLIKRGWAASESAYPGGDRQFALDTNSTIIPAHLPRSSGLRIPYYESSRVINYTGFDVVYNETFQFRGTQNDYVLKPGNTGVITFKIDAMASEQQGQDYPIPLPKSLNLTNYVIFYHEITSLGDLSKYPGVTFDGNDYGHFRACSTGPAGGGTCIGGTFGGTGPIEAFVTDHPGVDVLFEPPSEVLPLGMNATSQVVTMMITVDSNAPRGTYLVELPSIGLDSFLLTVGNQPYHE